MVDTILGTLVALGFILFSGPQVVAVWRADKLEGMSKVGWCALSASLMIILFQLVRAELWVTAGAQAINNCAVIFTTVAIWIKGK